MTRAQMGGRDSGMRSEARGMTWTFSGPLACLALRGRLMGSAYKAWGHSWRQGVACTQKGQWLLNLVRVFKLAQQSMSWPGKHA